MSSLFPRNPNYYLANFSLEKMRYSGTQGDILIFGGGNGRDVDFLVSSLLLHWDNPSYKVYVVDDFNDKFGRQRMTSFIDNTYHIRNRIVHYTSQDFSQIFNRNYAFVIFQTIFTSGEIYQLSVHLWNNLLDGGYMLYLNFNEGQTQYMGDLNTYPHEGIKRFFRTYSAFASDIGDTPHPFLGK